MKSRHIPNKVSDLVTSRHFFECAWCGDRLTERHHITEFAKGGKHASDNLILLCPNCHTQVHKGEILTEELVQRKSTHSKGDRFSGGVRFSLKKPNINLGNGQFNNVPTLLMLNDQPIINFIESNGEYLLTTRFYDKAGDLIFWMSSNRYWTSSNFTVSAKKEELVIKNEKDSNNYLRIWQDNDCLNLEGKNYMNGMIVDFTPNYIMVGTNKIMGFGATDCLVGIAIN